jgi:hypothetical protein
MTRPPIVCGNVFHHDSLTFSSRVQTRSLTMPFLYFVAGGQQGDSGVGGSRYSGRYFDEGSGRSSARLVWMTCTFRASSIRHRLVLIDGSFTFCSPVGARPNSESFAAKAPVDAIIELRP